MKKPVIAITVGDYNGVGPEVALRSITHPAVKKSCTPILVGPLSVFSFYARKLRIRAGLEEGSLEDMKLRKGPRATLVLPSSAGEAHPDIEPGKLSMEAGRISISAIEHAVQLTSSGAVHGIVTAPVSKQAMHMAGSRFPGQTEMLQQLTGSPHVAMMLVSRTMRVGLVTIHVPVRDIPSALTPDLLREEIRVIHGALVSDWGIRRPSLAVLGLNPHAGEGGQLGTEEQQFILPVIRELREEGIRLEGPFPADGFFARYRPGAFDAVVAMYHDQGLIPLKMSAGGTAVNYSAGLPIVRTSPDHGTGFLIAGKGKADPRSMVEAICLAGQIAPRRVRSRRRSP